MDLKKNFKNRAFKKGTYSVGMMFVVLAIVVIINMIVRALPATITKIDCSVNKLYTLTDTTTNYLKAKSNNKKDYCLYLESNDALEYMPEEMKVSIID